MATPAHRRFDIRSLAVALTLTLALPMAAAAQDAPASESWPSADELRAQLQAIDYEFAYDASGRIQLPEHLPELPALWTLTEPAVEGDVLPEGLRLEPFTLQLIDDGSGAVTVLFAGASTDDGVGEFERIATTLMEVESRLPEGNGLDEAVWFVGNKWQTVAERTQAPCVYRESDDRVMFVWFGGEADEATTFFGTVGPRTVLPDELELCRQALAQPQTPAASTDADASDSDPAEPSVDYSVPPDEAVAIIEAGTHTIIDVRTPAEYQQAHIVGAVNIDVEGPDFASRIAELDPAASYLVYCRSGRRSDLAAQQMAAAGFTDIVDGAGLADLARAGAPVE